ncbi:hypothetical protein PHISP_04717 [Aspergillus sp. HF37]|nr:hypothetical protein PHISP_04717 [Aspergillus sp. HF37]
MDFTSEWIAPLVERCLLSFPHPAAGVEWQDDGSNIRFVKYGPRAVPQGLISDWTEHQKPLRVTLRDSRNQIEAIVTSGALRQYQDFPDRELSKGRTHGYPMTLSDFEIVFEYSASKPIIHFYVKDFRVDWDYGRHRADPKKKITNDSGVSKLLKVAFTAAKELQQTRYQAIATSGDESDTSVRSQNNTNFHRRASRETVHDAGVSQEAFASQIPAVRQSTVSDIIPASKRDPHATKTGLLGHLERRPKKAEGGTAVNPNHMDQQGVEFNTSPHPVVEHEKQQLYSNRRDSKEAGDPSDLADGQTRTPAPAPEITATDTSNSNFNTDAGSPTVKKPGEKGTNGTCASQAFQEPAAEGSGTKNRGMKDTESQSDMGTFKRSKDANSNNYLNQGHSDPWSGMARIRAHDIRILADQADLLENKRFWVPPPPGMDLPRGHVPPKLLERWNKIVMQRHTLTQENQSNHTVLGMRNGEISPSRSSTSQMESEGGTPFSWAPTPSNREPHDELPADSSPIRARTSRQIKSPNANKRNAHGNQLPRDIEQATMGNTGEDSRVEPEDAGECHSPANSSHPEVTTPEPDNRACREHLENDSDGDSDSVMDTSVPCPLGGTTQQTQFTSQSEQEVTRPGPSHTVFSSPGKIQVTETPAADLSHLRSKGAPIDSSGSTMDEGEESSQQRSSEVGKWSSESRIVNTYGSNESKARRHQSQEGLNASLDEAGFNVHVMGTQESGESCLMHETTPHSQSAVVLDSSEVGRRARSGSVSSSAPQAAPSQPCPSLREVPFSQSEGESHGLSMCSSSRGTQSQRDTGNSQVPTLKRPAAEVEDDHPSPKRHKSAAHENGDSRNGTVEETMKPDTATRRQSYLSGSSKLADSLRAHEKFRSDYLSYSGDFTHFTELCHKLQCLRTEGKLTKSFLWDDFIIMHLQEYPGYAEECDAAGRKTLEYEDYFISHFSKAVHRRRSLTASAIELGAAQYASADQQNRPTSATVAGDEANPSSAQSRVDELPHSQASSHETAPSGRSGVDDGRSPATNSAPAGRNHDTSANERGSEPVEEPSSSNNNNNNNARPPTSSFESTDQEIKQDDSEPIIDETEDNDDEGVDIKMEGAHDTESIELGEEDNPRASPHEAVDNEDEAPSEPASINENWFVSLRHIRPSGPVWSDDRNTPFKAWARADLNVKSERRLRGGRFLAVDNDGVIQRATTGRFQ